MKVIFFLALLLVPAASAIQVNVASDAGSSGMDVEVGDSSSVSSVTTIGQGWQATYVKADLQSGHLSTTAGNRQVTGAGDVSIDASSVVVPGGQVIAADVTSGGGSLLDADTSAQITSAPGISTASTQLKADGKIAYAYAGKANVGVSGDYPADFSLHQSGYRLVQSDAVIASGGVDFTFSQDWPPAPYGINLPQFAQYFRTEGAKINALAGKTLIGDVTMGTGHSKDGKNEIYFNAFPSSGIVGTTHLYWGEQQDQFGRYILYETDIDLNANYFDAEGVTMSGPETAGHELLHTLGLGDTSTPAEMTYWNCEPAPVNQPTGSYGAGTDFALELLYGRPSASGYGETPYVWNSAQMFGNYWCAEGGGGGAVNANRALPRQWESLKVYNLGNYYMAFQAPNGQFLCAEGGGGGIVVANRNAIGPWEVFKQIDVGGGKVAYQAFNGQYLCAENGGGAALVANRNAIGLWETFYPAFPG